jgi:hypothetical protein
MLSRLLRGESFAYACRFRISWEIGSFFSARWSARSRRKAGPRLVNKSLSGLHRRGFMAAKFFRYEPIRLRPNWDLQKLTTKPKIIPELKNTLQIIWNVMHGPLRPFRSLFWALETSASLRTIKRGSLRIFLSQNLTLGLILSIAISNLEPRYITVCVVTSLLIAVSS